jgi:hypothetical protein
VDRDLRRRARLPADAGTRPGSSTVGLALALAVLQVLVAASSSRAQTGAKSLFEAGGSAIVASPRTALLPGPGKSSGGSGAVSPVNGRPPLALRYSVRLVSDADRNGREVAVSRTFRSGERIRLVVQTNVDGYVSVAQIGTDGTAGMLYPDPAGGLAMAQVGAFQDVLVPGPDHFFRFDETAGVERLFLVFARDPAELEPLALASTMAAGQVAALRWYAEREHGAKNLVLEEDPGAASYVADLQGRVVVQEIGLAHVGR